MIFHVEPLRDKFEVFDGIVLSVFVEVMNVLVCFEDALKELFHYEAVLVEDASVFG